MLFLFGTLRHPALLAVVTGRADAADDLRLGSLPGWHLSGVAGDSFPMLSVQAGAQAPGALYPVPSQSEWDRLDAYEAIFGYTRTEVTARDAAGNPVTAQLYVPRGDTPHQPHGDWALDHWQSRWAGPVTHAAAEVMDLIDAGTDPASLTRRYPQILQRGASRERASGGAPPGQAAPGVQLHERRRPYSNFFAVEEYDIAFRRFDGSMTPPSERGLFMGGDAALVLPYDPALDQVLLIEQFRPGPFGRGDPQCWITEPVAGRIDPGETPEQAARREALEEAGLTLTDLHPVAQGYPSPGASTEYFYIYIGLCDLSDRQGEGLGGLADESEDIRHFPMPYADFDARLTSGGFNLVPLLLAGHWLARNRATLRAGLA